MIKYAIRRTLLALPVLFGISLVTFAILHLAPGGPEQKFDNNPKVTPAQIQAFEARWGLDKPIPIQYFYWLGIMGPEKPPVINALPAFLGGGDNGIIHGDLGFSINTGTPVADVIGQRLPATVILAGTAYLIYVFLAFVLGVYAAVYRYSLFDTLFTIFTYIGFALPTFILGLLLIFAFTQEPLKLFPVSGMWDTRTIPPFGTSLWWALLGSNPIQVLSDLASHLVLPVTTLAVVSIAGDSRFIRASMLDALDQDYIRTARAKGVPVRGVIYRHALRNALLPAITNIGLEIPLLFTGAIVTETIFSWPGMGRLTIEATNEFDYPVLMGILIITAGFVVLANIAADVAYAVVDPRVRYD